MAQFRKFIFALLFIVGLVSLGTSGFMILEGWSFTDSLYMTFVTVSTVGFGEVHPLSQAGKIFTIIFLTVSIITIGYTVTIIISYVFEGHVLNTIKERKMKNILSLIKGHYIICGYGDVGREAAEELDRKNIPFIIVDHGITNPELDRNPDFLVIREDATEELILEKARIYKAKGLLSCLPDDQSNVYTTLTARQMNPNLHIVAKASDIRARKKLLTAGADKVILPKQIAGRRMATIATHPAIIDFLDVLSTGGDGQMRIESVPLKSRSGLIGKSLKESEVGKDTGVIIIGILDSGGKTKIVSNTMESISTIKLEPEDQLIALGTEEQIKKLHQVVE